MADRAFIERVSRQMVDDGRLIEAGWLGLRIACKLEDAPKNQLEEMRNAFFAGAQHLFSSIMTILDPGADPTAKDLERMDAIDRELKTFINDFSIRNLPTGGSA